VDFTLSDEQKLLKNSVDRLIADKYDLDVRRALVSSEDGFGRENWQTFAELGWLAIPFSEADGGLGGGAVEIMVLMEAFGRGLVVEPFLSTILTGASFVEALGDKEQKEAILPSVIEGKKLLSFAHVEPQARFTLSDIATNATSDGSGYSISGQKAVVFGGDSADQLIVSARISGEQRDEKGISLFLVDTDTKGLTRRSYQTVDGLRAADVSLKDVRVSPQALLGKTGDAFTTIETVIDRATAAVCAEAVGAMDALHEQTLEYLKTREQFGVALGKFQALQHRSVDMFIACQEARTMTYLATLSLDKPRNERIRAVSGAKSYIGRAGRLVGQEAVQLHGGMG
ncbi:uncharacterized protein METZ01_LOCUS219372, partial [marine metagenome]